MVVWWLVWTIVETFGNTKAAYGGVRVVLPCCSVHMYLGHHVIVQHAAITIDEERLDTRHCMLEECTDTGDGSPRACVCMCVCVCVCVRVCVCVSE